ncbi:MAG: sodium-dependent transporter [Elusimicrobiota bacterium]|nr:sodium-dependent transporter [Elusimicrobiota bacterium]
MIKKTVNYFSDIHRAQWKTKSGFILAVIGSAVGLGNIWRFSYLCYEHGGGAFLIPYFIALIIVGIPLMLLEFAIGHRQKGSAPKSFYKIDKKWEWVGWWPVVFVMFGIVMYYSVIISWSLNYVFYSFNLSWGTLPNDFFFNDFLNISAGPAQFGGIKTSILFGLLAIWAINWVIVFFGIEKGIERASKILMPMLLLLTLVLVVWAVNLPGAKAGIVQYLKPDFSKLAQIRVWVDAFTQIFFTLSLGFGIMIAYASYLPKKADLAGNAIITVVANSLFSFVAGFAVWGTLGYMAARKNLPISDVVEQSIGLAFVAYPQAISLMKNFAPLFGVFFFSILVFAGLSSSISIIEAFTSSVMDKFHFKRTSVVSVVCITGFIGSIIFATGAGLYWLDIVDHFLTSYGLITVGILQCLIIGWALKASKLREHINDISSIHIGKWWDIVIKIVTPSILAIILIWSLYGEFSAPYEGYSVTALILIGRDWLLATLVAAIILTRYRWRSRKG